MDARTVNRPQSETVVTDIPSRLDRLAFGPFHRFVVLALGITWILDGLEVTVVGSLSGVLAAPTGLNLSSTEVGLAGSAYLAGAVIGALVFGHLADRHGRKKLFFATVGVYLVATVLTGLTWNFWTFAVCRFFTGTGIGGEYSAINSAIQEFVPARLRGRTDLIVNGTFWLGAAFGAIGSLVVLDPAMVPPRIGWRAAFVIGGVLAGIVIFLRHWVPESPRWLMIRGRVDEAERIVADIERRSIVALPQPARRIRLRPQPPISLATLARTLCVHYRPRMVVGLVLMATQAFCYNAIFFTYALILTRFYGVSAAAVGWFMLAFAVGNLLGPVMLGHLFDTLGRRRMIAGTYALAGALVAATGALFAAGAVDAMVQTGLWTLTFFFASAGACAAYLTVGESFPLEVRARTIGLFSAFGTAIGGIAGPALFGALIESGSRSQIRWGYFLGGFLMVGAAATEAVLGVDAEGRALEEVAPPLSALAGGSASQ